MKRAALDGWIQKTESLAVLDRKTLLALQLKKLNALLARERERGGFYAGLPARLARLEELSSLPFTTPEELARSPGAFLLCSQGEAGRVVTGATSGTTGLQKRLFYTQGDLENTIGFFAAGISELAGAGDAVMIAMPFSGPFGLGDLIARAVERLGARPLRTGVGRTLGELRKELHTERPAAYIGMPVPLLGLLRYAGPVSLRRALVSADAVPASVGQNIERLLGSRLFPHYGSRELCMGGAVTCAAHGGMHLRENHVIAEIVGPGGQPLPEGEWGELVLTTIGLQAMPLIRYRTGDITRILPGRCPCGSPTRRLAPVRRQSPEDLPERLDSLLFAQRGLIDARYTLLERELRIQAVCLPGAHIGLPEGVRQLFPGKKITLVTAQAGEGTVVWPGKRVLLREKDES